MLDRISQYRLALVAGLLLAGCSSGGTESAADNSEQASTVAPPADRLPGCDELANAIGAPIATMGRMPASQPERWSDGEKYGILCTWGTDAAIRAEAGQTGNIGEIANIGTVTLRVSVNDNVMAESDARAVGMVLDDPRAKAIGGWIMANPKLDLAGKPGVAPPQVNVGVTTIYIGAANSSAPELASLTNDWAINSAITAHRMIRHD